MEMLIDMVSLRNVVENNRDSISILSLVVNIISSPGLTCSPLKPPARNQCFFFFQAEDGIRAATVTGVQTCALPISLPVGDAQREPRPHELEPREANAPAERLHRSEPGLDVVRLEDGRLRRAEAH